MSEAPNTAESTLEKLQNAGIYRLPHVPTEEMHSAICRALAEHVLPVDRDLPAETIAELIDTNEEQTDVHEEPGDPE